ncbi:hypothetical protein [Qaidamihabitans albus]|uniref:hypothetical protein n=1 Tax=Qaidamihabitans albus TaxID=2795733 RepID=UPI0018F20770|nr:hypothetical protein [Qaidamihabitans albus]
MSALVRGFRAAPWTVAAAAYAWCAAIVLTVLLEPGTLLIVAPPALVASAPLLLPRRHQSPAAALGAVALAAWAFLGIALLGLYFLPSAALLAAGYVRRTLSARSVRRCAAP